MNTQMPFLNECVKVGAALMKRRVPTRSSKIFDKRWRSHFACSPEVCTKVWVLFTKRNQEVSMDHLLWEIYLLKVYPTENEACSKVDGIDEKTWRKIIWWIIDALADLESDIVSIFYLL